MGVANMIDAAQKRGPARRHSGFIENLAASRHLITTAFAMMLAGGLAPVGVAAAAAQSGQPAEAPAPSANPFPAEASKLGVQRCANLYSALGQTVSFGSDYAVLTQTEPSAPDAHAVQGLVGITYSGPDHNGQAAGIVLAAPVGDSCEGQMIRVAPFQRSCADTLSLLPAGSTTAGQLSGVPLYELGGNQGQALLVSSGTSCVVVTVARAAEVP